MSVRQSHPASHALPTGRDAAAWGVADLEQDRGWIQHLDAEDRAELLTGLRAGLASRDASGLTPAEGAAGSKHLLFWRRSDFPFGARVLERLAAALHEAQHRRGIALIKALPRDALSVAEFELLIWAIGLHLGVARPQDKLTRYINAVKDVGVDYRSPTGRGYSSKSDLEFHVDSGDAVLLGCYNQAPIGGESLCSSSVLAWRQLLTERPDLARVLASESVPFSRQGEQAEGEDPWLLTRVFAYLGDDMYCAWNRNRIHQGFKLEGAPAASAALREAVDLLDAILRRPAHLFRMMLEPGDLQILSNHTTLHSRTAFEDHPDEARKRILFRLWLSTPDGPALPRGWAAKWGTEERGYVRGGMRGHHYDEDCLAFERRQAGEMGLRLL